MLPDSILYALNFSKFSCGGMPPDPPRRNVLHTLHVYPKVVILSTFDCAREQIEKAQQKQKRQHDKHSKDPGFKVGDRVFVYMPASRCGESYKFSKPFKGPFCITSVYNNGADLKSIAKPRSKPIRVAFNRIRRCPKEMQNSEDIRSDTEDADDFEEENNESEVPSWSGRLRSRPVLHSEDAGPKEGEM